MIQRQPKGSRERANADGSKLGRELLGLFSIFCGLLLILSLATFDSRDPWLNHVVSGVTRVYNKAGVFGSYLGGMLYDVLGIAAWVVPGFFCLAGARRILGSEGWAWWRWSGLLLLTLCLCIAGAARDLDMVEIFARGVLPAGSGNVSAHGGGLLGHILYVGMVGWLSTTGTVLVWLFSLMLAIQMLTGISWLSLLIAGATAFWQTCTTMAGDAAENLSKRKQTRLELDARPLDISPSRPLEVMTLASAPQPDPFTDAQADDDDDLDDIFSPRKPDSEAYASAPPLRIAETTIAAKADVPEVQDINHGVERPDLFRQPASVASQPVSSDVVANVEVPAFSPPAAAAPSAGFMDPPQHLSLANTPKTARLQNDDDADLPPWVRDFELDRHGVQAPPSEEPVQRHVPAPQEPGSLELLWDFHGMGQAAAGQGDAELPTTNAFAHADSSLPFAAVASVWQPADMPQPEPSFPSFPASPEKMEPPVSPLQQGGWQSESIAPEEVAIPQPVAIPVPTPAAFSGQAHEQAAYSSSIPSLSTVSQAPSVPASQPAVERVAITAPPAAYSSAEEIEDEETPGYSGDIPIFEAPKIEISEPQPSSGLMAGALKLIKKPVRAPLPPLDMLEAAPAASGGTPRSVLESKGRSLMTCLSDFGIQGELMGITPGPVVTMFEVRPAPGVRVSRIANLSDDLALALKAVAVRIQAPVPGTDTVGIEIPNEVRETVCLKELLSSQLFQQSKSLLTLAIGKDIAGLPAVADLATMPHLLVAGATGAGKSVGINSIILSLIYKARPEEVKLLLIDPKRVEMAIYSDLPHLVHPVVTEMQLAKNALEWAVTEMERRYSAIAKASVRNITDYNAKVAAWGDTPPNGLEELEVMPYLVIVIDELADLMLVAAKEVETSIVRLAQLARAAGIHLILATQRPSVDVVTGLIKANFPCRISFQVTSKHDSRTILDTVGAEHLLGRGDMLFKPAGGKFQRMHGAFVSDKNVHSVVDYWRSKQRPDYQIDFADWAPDVGGSFSGNGGGGGGGDISADPMYNEAVEFVRQQGKASISLIQRKFRIGFNKAARFVEQMEQDGIIGPPDGSRPRMVNR